MLTEIQKSVHILYDFSAVRHQQCWGSMECFSTFSARLRIRKENDAGYTPIALCRTIKNAFDKETAGDLRFVQIVVQWH